MKTIGLLGGMSWESTATYYTLLNQLAREARGGLHSAPILLHSFDFAPIAAMQEEDRWEDAAEALSSAAKGLEAAGAECIAICTNTMHKVSIAVEDAVSIPLIHTVDALAHAIKDRFIEHPLLLATRYTMEEEFYVGRLRDKHGLDVRIPSEDDRTDVHRIIYGELCQGKVDPESRAEVLEIVRRAMDPAHGVPADGVVFGCTEVGLLLKQSEVPLPVFDTTQIHVQALVDFALA